MKFLLLLLFALPVFGQSIEDQIKTFEKPKTYSVEYDKFDKVTRVEWHGLIKAFEKKRGSSLAVKIIKNVYDSGSVSYYLSLDTGSRSTLYNHDRLRFLLDNESMDVADDTGIEYFASFIVTDREFEQITSAKTVEMRFGTFQTVLDTPTLKVFRNLASITRSPR